MYSVNFVGLNYFNACPGDVEACAVEDKEALIPNGLNGEDGVPQHFASFFVERSQYDSDNWWPDQKLNRKITLEVKLGEFRTVEVIEFRIPKQVRLYFRSDWDEVRNMNLDDGLPKLQDVDGFELDPDAATKPDRVIANVPIPGGDLEVFRFGSSALVRWSIIKHKIPITITAFTTTNEKRRVTLKRSDEQLPTEIVFSNTVELLPHDGNGNNGAKTESQQPMPHDDHTMNMDHSPAANANGNSSNGNGSSAHSGHSHRLSGHFALYAKLDKNEGFGKFKNPPVLPDAMRLKPLPFSHAYLAYLSSLEEIPDPPCVPSCCAKG